MFKILEIVKCKDTGGYLHLLKNDLYQVHDSRDGEIQLMLSGAGYWYPEKLFESVSAKSIVNQGVKGDESKPLVALIPAVAIEEEALVWTFGAKKYAAWNWRKGLKYTRVLSAMLRHTLAIMRGEDIDLESGLLHAAHVRCCAGMLIDFHKSGRKDLDDRAHMET